MNKSSNPDIVRLKGRQTSGAEHSVWLDEERGEVHKIPNWFGKIWQDPRPEAAEFDYETQCRHGLTVTPTENHGETLVRNGKVHHEVAEYYLRQGYLDAETLRVAHLFHSEEVRRQLLDIFSIGQVIRQSDSRGLDIVGGQLLGEFGAVLNPRKKTLNPSISNLKLPDADIHSKIEMSKCGVEVGDVIAREGKLTQIDTRLYNLDDRRGYIRAILLRFQDAQDATISTLLKKFGFETGFNCDANRLRRMVRYLVERAFPKMQAYADGMAG